MVVDAMLALCRGDLDLLRLSGGAFTFRAPRVPCLKHPRRRPRPVLMHHRPMIGSCIRWFSVWPSAAISACHDASSAATSSAATDQNSQST